MNQLVSEMLAKRLVESLSDAEPGHCVRIDDVAQNDAEEIAHKLKEFADNPKFLIAILSSHEGEGRVTVETAVSIRNDKSHVFILVVPPGVAHAASSLDNSFERLSLVDELLQVEGKLKSELTSRWSNLPVNVVLRSVDVPLEARLDYLSAVLSAEESSAFGRELWRLGLLVDTSEPSKIRSNLAWNNEVVKAVINPVVSSSTSRENLRKAGVAPGQIFEKLLSSSGSEGQGQRDKVEWARDLFEHHQIELNRIPKIDSDGPSLAAVVVESFVKDGIPKASSKLTLTENGTLYIASSKDKPSSIGLKWKTDPAQASNVANWRIELLPPDDLRGPENEAVIETKVPGKKRSSNFKLNLDSDDLDEGSLFVIRITALDQSGTPIVLQSGFEAAGDSDQFEVGIGDASSETSARKQTASSIANAKLTAMLAGSMNTEVDMQAWDFGGRVFSLRIGKQFASRIRITPLTIELVRRVISDSGISNFEATSSFGRVIDGSHVTEGRNPIPSALVKKRKEVLKYLEAAAPQDTPEVFEWNEETVRAANEYAQTYKRALDSADRETLRALLLLDTLSIEVDTAVGVRAGVVVLPIHPIRLAWIANHYELALQWSVELEKFSGAPRRQREVDHELFSRVLPSNLPFSTLSADDDVFFYFDEVSFGSGLYLNAAEKNPEMVASEISKVMGIPRESPSITATSKMVHHRLNAYRSSHPESNGLRITSMNPGDGEILGNAIESIVRPDEQQDDQQDDQAESDVPRIEIVSYGRNAGFSAPFPRLSKLQKILQDEAANSQPNHLAPQLGLMMRDSDSLFSDDWSSHVSSIQDVANLSQGSSIASTSDRMVAFHDLLTPLVTIRVETDSGPAWSSAPALTPSTDGVGKSVVEAHRVHQSALGKYFGLDAAPALVASIDPDGLQAIRVFHELSDWVLTLDRFIGLDLYQDPGSFGLGGQTYMLDYSPDFIEGLSHKLTVTTRNWQEVAHVLKRAVEDLGLSSLNETYESIVNSLLSVSGRLVLRLQGSESFAREAVSLAALVTHLKARAKLDNAIIVPIDSHDEIFGLAAREADQPKRRCDLLLVHVQRGGLQLELLEVKSRKAAAVPAKLAEDIVEQLEETRKLLVSRFFDRDNPRVDISLQRARLAGVLHYHADRAVINGLIDANKIADIHRLIDRHIESGVSPKISMHGYVISLHGKAGIPDEHRQVPISVLTAQDLGQAGFSTVYDLDRESPEYSPEISAKVADLESGDRNLVENQGAIDVVSTESGGNESHETDTESTSSVEMSTVLEKGPPAEVKVLLGKDGQGVDMVWPLSTKGSPHAFIIGIPGQGKSVTTRRIIKSFANAGLPSLLFDFHGDMAALPPEGTQVLDASNGLPFQPFENVDNNDEINPTAYETAEIIGYVADLGDIQRSHVYKALQEAYAEALEARVPGAPSVSQFAARLEEVETRLKGKNARERVQPLTDFKPFSIGTEGVFDPRSGGMVVDVSSVKPEKTQLGVTAFLLRKVYREMVSWPQDGTLKLAIVLDEAHRMSKDVTLPKLMKEGRKYGVVVVVASQGAADFNKDVIANAGTKIVFRTNFPDSKKISGFLRGRNGQDLSLDIEKLGVGEAFVSIPDVAQARKTYMEL